jgi:DNA-binding transcriptional regulator YdaS (Cro superfamily)
MDVAGYLKKHKLTQKELADRLGCHQTLISQLVLGTLTISAERAVEFEKKTRGEIHRADLRPDLWSRRAA